MNRTQITDVFKYSCVTLICFTLISPLISKQAGQIAAGLILIAGSLTILTGFFFKLRQVIPAPAEKLYTGGCLAYLLLIFLNIYFTGDITSSGGKTDLYSYLLIPAFLFPFLRLTNFNRSHLIYACAAVSFITGALAIIEFIQTGGGRTGYLYHGQPIPFGNLSLCTGFLCLLFLDLKNSRTLNLILSACALFALIACLSSQTRGGFIAIPAFLIFLIVFKRRFFIRKPVLLPMAGAIILVTAATISSGLLEKVGNRVNSAVTNTSSFIDDGNKRNSSGIRLSLWQIGIQGWLEAPVLGQGVTKFYPYKEELILNKEQSDYLLRFKHTHNEYVEILFTRGLLGLLLFMSLISVLSLYYLKRTSDSVLAVAGLMTTSGYMIFSLTESFFSLHTSLLFFVTFNTLLVFLISSEEYQARIQNHAP